MSTERKNGGKWGCEDEGRETFTGRRGVSPPQLIAHAHRSQEGGCWADTRSEKVRQLPVTLSSGHECSSFSHYRAFVCVPVRLDLPQASQSSITRSCRTIRPSSTQLCYRR